MANCLPKNNLDSPICVNSIIVAKKTPMEEAEVFDTNPCSSFFVSNPNIGYNIILKNERFVPFPARPRVPRGAIIGAGSYGAGQNRRQV